MVREGTFREDLYYRLNVVSINIPPLRERGNDILLLTDYFLEKYCLKYKRKLSIDRSVYQIFVSYDWPGNVRELQNTVESAVVLCETDTVRPADISENIRKRGYGDDIFADETPGYTFGEGTLKEVMEKLEKQFIVHTLERCGGDRHKAIEELGMSRRTFYRKIAEYEIKK